MIKEPTMENISLPVGWEMKKLANVLNIQNGYAFNSKLFSSESGIPLIRIRDIKKGIDTVIKYTGEYDKKYEVNSGDFLIGMDGEFGCYEWKGEKALLNQRVCRLQDFNKIDSKFLFYGINKYLKDIEDVTTFTTVKHISSSQIKNIQFPLPPLPQQKQIVLTLDKAFAAIDTAKANAEQNLQNAKELFESYLQIVFENKGDDWEEKSLGKVAEVTYGFTGKAYEEGDYRYVRITDIDDNGELNKANKKYLKSSEEGLNFLLNDNDIVMARTGATFAKLLLYKDLEPSIFASYLIRIDFFEDIENEFYWYFSKSRGYWEQAENLSSGAAQPHFNGKALKQMVFSYPKSLQKQKSLISEFKALQNQTKKLEAIYTQKIADLEEMKKSILQKAFSGQLNIQI